MQLQISKSPKANLSSRLIEELGLDSASGRSFALQLRALLLENEHCQPWFKLWSAHMAQYVDLQTVDRSLGLNMADFGMAAGCDYFIAQTYCRILVDRLTSRLVEEPKLHPCSDVGLLSWYIQAGGQEALCSEIESAIQRVLETAESVGDPIAVAEIISQIFEDYFPPNVRHLTGEYYTPPWVIEHALDHLTPTLDGVCLDPAVGSAGFLVHWARRCVDRSDKLHVVGFDINPLAVDMASASLSYAKDFYSRSNGLSLSFDISLGDSICPPRPSRGRLFESLEPAAFELMGFEIPVGREERSEALDRLTETLLRGSEPARLRATIAAYVTELEEARAPTRATHVCGNPPWITWDGLKNGYRDRLASEWKESPLASHRGWRAKVAAGKTDISSLFVYQCADVHASKEAQMVFVLPISLFKSRRAAEGFRRFTTKSGRSYSLSHLDDFSNVRLFDDASNRPCVASFRVDHSSHYPASGTIWQWSNDEKSNGVVIGDRAKCRPLSDSDNGSPIVCYREDDKDLFEIVGPSAYRARGGVNTGGANSILWVEVVDRDESLYLVRNIGRTMRSQSPVREAWIEKDVVFPLLTGKRISRWSAKPDDWLLLFYNAENPKKAIPEAVARKKYPLAYSFVSMFEEELRSRREYHRWGAIGPFYETYRIGPYTFSPLKVVWQHTGFQGRMRAAVLNTDGSQPIIPDQKVIIVATQDETEAHYICGYLNSELVARLLRLYLLSDASTHILDFVGLDRFEQTNPLHVQISRLAAEAAHHMARGKDCREVEARIERAVVRLKLPATHNAMPVGQDLATK